MPGFFLNLPKPETQPKVHRRFSDDVDLIERKLLRILALLRDDNWLDPAKSGDLPVDVQHLRLEKSRAVKGGDRSWIRWVAQCLESNIEQEKSKINCEELDPFPLSGLGIEHHAVFGFAVLRRSLRVQHLKWISAPRGARKNAVCIFFLNRRWWRRGTSFHASRERFLLRCGQRQARDRHQNPQHHELLHSFSPVKAAQVLAG